MPQISRNNDKASTGHSCSSTAGVNASQFSVFANGRAVVRPGDKLQPHTILRCFGNKCFCVGHRAKVNSGSGSVFAQGVPVARVGDSADRGSMIQGSPNVFAG
jgi:uncharacterized Zn-binding protein involved in type VI secretion